MLKTTKPEEVGFSAERLNLINARMQNYIDRRTTGGILTLIERRGKIVHLGKFGYQDLATQKPIEYDHIFRIYSMTKPIVSLALMMLFEKAKFNLSDPILKYLPEFEDVKVHDSDGMFVPPKTPPNIQQLLTHTAGLTYGAFGETEVDKLYQEADLFDKTQSLEEMVKKIASLPLTNHPGERWVYSVATDVVGRLVEVISGMNLADYLDEKIFTPLGMTDTVFSVHKNKVGRLTTCYGETETEKLAVFDPGENSAFCNVNLFSGGGGLVSTLEDYLQFARLILNQGELNGVRLISRKTLELMAANHIPDRLLPLAVTEPFPGFGFGLGFSVLMNIAETLELGSAGVLSWGGLAGTTFWVDPLEDMLAILMTQYIPLAPFLLQADFRTLTYQALVD